MTTNRRWTAIGAAVVAALGLVALGNWERDKRADEQSAGMAMVVAEIGPLDNARLASFRLLTNFHCLGYRQGENPVALEVCADVRGRVVEAFDRRAAESKIWSLRDDPAKSTVRVDRAEMDRLLVRMGVPQRLIDDAYSRGAD